MKKNSIINPIFLFLSLYLIFTIKWSIKVFGILPLEQILFQLNLPLKGTSVGLIYNYLIYTLSYTLIFFIIFLLLSKSSEWFFKKEYVYLNLIIKNKDIKIQILPLHLFSKRASYLITTSIIITFIFAFNTYDVKAFVNNMITSSTFIQDNYVEPKTTKITSPQTKRNLIHIYVESLESSYIDTNNGGLLNYNLIPNLTKIANENISFSNNSKLGGLYNLTGTTWTIAALISQTAGIPLKLAIDGNSYSKEYGQFLNGAYSLGEVLENNGYTNVFMLGSDSTFAARKTYFEQNGSYEIWDYNTAIKEEKIPEDYYVFWGYEDNKLFEFAKEKITTLSQNDNPFNFTLLTVDMHPYGGYLSENCEDLYDLQIENVISCSDILINNFIDWLKQQEFYENTTIVITGDHLNMDSEIFNNKKQGRTIYNVFINSAVTTENTKNRIANVFDVYPTTLAALGFEIEGNKLALGTNLFSNEKTLLEKYDIDYVDEELSKSSKFYKKTFLYSSK